MPKKQNSTRKQFRGMKMVIGRKSKKNNIKPKQYKKSKRYGKSKRYNKTQRGGGVGWGDITTKIISLKKRGQEIKEKAQSALNEKKNVMKSFITENQSKINVEETKTKILDKLDAAKKNIEALMSKLKNDDENIENIVNDGAEFIDSDDVVLNEGQIEGPNDGQIEESNEEDN
jgi:uncharacterized protein YlxP (DUF503 family)